jgi:lysozyme family protein
MNAGTLMAMMVRECGCSGDPADRDRKACSEIAEAGPGSAIGFLQRALNALNRGASDYSDVAVDGCIGPATIGALDAFLICRKPNGATVLLKAIRALRGEHHVTLAQDRPTDQAFPRARTANHSG